MAMARKIVRPEWKKAMRGKIDSSEDIDVVTSFNPSIQWLIKNLSEKNIPYKLYQLGAGVKRIVTVDVDTCPCCKRKLK